MNLSWPSAAAACRRACWSPRLAGVISRSISGLAALAFASVVLIRSCWMTSLERFISSALRCAESRLSLCRCFWWRMDGPEPSFRSGVAEVETARLQRLDNLLDRLATEVRDRRQLRLRLLQQLADGLDAGALQAVVRTDAQLDLLDGDVSHRPAAGAGGTGSPRAAKAGRRSGAIAGTGLQLLEALGVREDRERLDEDLRGLAQRGLRVDRTVRLDVECQAVVVRALADAGAGHAVGDALDGREDRVDRNDADRLIRTLVLLGRRVATATADRQVDLELGLLLERGDVLIGVEDLDA